MTMSRTTLLHSQVVPHDSQVRAGEGQSTMRKVVVMGALGLALGGALGFIGFGDYGELFRMFTLADARLFLTFGGAVAVTAVGLRLFVTSMVIPKRRLTRSVPIGAALFGVGWVLAGACPGVALVQLGEGCVPAFATFAGILMGVRIYDAIDARLARRCLAKLQAAEGR